MLSRDLGSLATRTSCLEGGGPALDHHLAPAPGAPQETTALVQRVAPVAAPAESLSLHATADLVDHLGAEPADVAGVQDLHRVWWLVDDGRRPGPAR